MQNFRRSVNDTVCHLYVYLNMYVKVHDLQIIEYKENIIIYK